MIMASHQIFPNLLCQPNQSINEEINRFIIVGKQMSAILIYNKHNVMNLIEYVVYAVAITGYI